MTLSSKELKAWGEEGFFVGPAEKAGPFVKRVEFLKRLKQTAPEHLKELSHPLDLLEGRQWDVLLDKIKETMGCRPQWIITHYSNRKLSFWQGGASWIYTTPEGVQFPLIQLNLHFKKARYFFYSRSEVLLHETLHALRSNYAQSRFEEIFAYFLSKKKWRAFLGPLFRTPSEALIFVLTLPLSIGFQGLSLYFFDSPLLALWQFFSFSPLLYLSFLSLRLWRDQKIFRKALKKIHLLFPEKDNPFSVAFRLTDAEIHLFAHNCPSTLSSYIQKKQKKSLRWQQILAE